MAYKINNTVTIDDNKAGSFANVTIQNNGVLEVNSSDGFQGTVAGYASGGGYGVTLANFTDKFPFASDTNATDVGDLTQRRTYTSGQSSSTHGYNSGGFAPARSTIIDKFPFATDTNASSVGNLTLGRSGPAGQSSSTHGYASGGFTSALSPNFSNTIDKFPFATDTNATDVGDLTLGRQIASNQSSTTNGYVGGGFESPGPTMTNVIDKFPFAADTNATDVGDLTQARVGATGQSSTTHGYASGGQIPSPNTPPFVNTIEKFPFSTDTNATDIADLTQGRYGPAGQSSTDFGYTSGGSTPSASNVIDKFPFATDSNATDVGDLTLSIQSIAGNQD